MPVSLDGTHNVDFIAVRVSQVLLDVGAYQVFAGVDGE